MKEIFCNLIKFFLVFCGKRFFIFGIFSGLIRVAKPPGLTHWEDVPPLAIVANMATIPILRSAAGPVSIRAALAIN